MTGDPTESEAGAHPTGPEAGPRPTGPEAGPHPTGPEAGPHAITAAKRDPNALDQFVFLARRSFLRVIRQPSQLFFPLLFPLMLLLFNSQGLSNVVKLQGFPAQRYIDFALASTFFYGAANLATSAGSNLAIDISTGFLDRMRLTPVSGPILLLGHWAGLLGVALLNGCLYLFVGRLLGAHIAAGWAGVPAILGLGVLVAAFFTGLGSWLALKVGTTEAVEGLFPIFFALLFLSSSNFPRQLMKVQWFKAVATANPLSYAIEAIRSVFITGWDGQALTRGLVILLVGIAVVLTLGARAAHSRVGRV